MKKMRSNLVAAYVADRARRSPEFRIRFEKRRLIHEVAVAVRSMRTGAGMTQAQLAKAIGSSQPTIARLEKGLDQRTPRWDLLRRIALALNKQLKLSFVSRRDENLVEIDGKRPSPPAEDMRTSRRIKRSNAPGARAG